MERLLEAFFPRRGQSDVISDCSGCDMRHGRKTGLGGEKVAKPPDREGQGGPAQTWVALQNEVDGAQGKTRVPIDRQRTNNLPSIFHVLPENGLRGIETAVDDAHKHLPVSVLGFG